MLLRLLKNWTLPVAMLSGTLCYFLLAYIPLFAPAKPTIGKLITYATPTLIFLQLFLTFSKIELREMKPKIWHLWLILFQIVSCLLVVALLLSVEMTDSYRSAFEGLMVCLICPTATAAAVITGKLGGSPATLTTYTLLSNLLAAVTVPLLFPLVEAHADITFLAAFWKILSKVFPLLLFPIVLAEFVRRCFPSIHRLLLKLRDASFYLWAVALAIVTGQTVQSFVHSKASAEVLMLVAFGGLLACGVQFYLGKRIGGHYAERISGGQALGQKNTILAIWMAYTYLNPLSSVAPGSYVLWQNLVNSYQLWKKRKREEAQATS